MQPKPVNGDAVGEVEMHQSPDGSVRLDVRTDRDTVCLTRQQIGDLFGRDVKTIGKHVEMHDARNLPTKQLSQDMRQLTRTASATRSSTTTATWCFPSDTG